MAFLEVVQILFTDPNTNWWNVCYKCCHLYVVDTAGSTAWVLLTIALKGSRW